MFINLFGKPMTVSDEAESNHLKDWFMKCETIPSPRQTQYCV